MSQEYDDIEYEDYDDPVYDLESEEEKNYSQNNKNSSLRPQLLKKGSTIFVTINDIKQLIKQKCKDVNELLGLPEDEAIILYSWFKWRKDLLEGEYFGNEDTIRQKAGIDPEEPAAEDKSQILTCPLCFDTKDKSEFEALKCNHYLCKDCWTDYIEYNVTKLENTFFWKCPSQGCNVVVPNTFNLKYIQKDHEPQFYKKLAISYADTSKSLRWCPAPDCNYGAEVESVGVKSIECPCGWMYCFKCGLEDHRPCSCDIAIEWMKKDEGGGANAKWLLVHTKDCPKCKRPIEKNQGCNYMKCRQPGCNFEFCWLCLSDWKTHNDHFRCNRYDNLSAEEKSKMDCEKQEERKDLQKYVFYYERYLNNSMAIESANKIRKAIKNEEKDLAINLALTLTQLEFLEQGCQILRNVKRTLRWSYAYGFYLNNNLQRNLYEIIQEKMDMYSSELHVLLEKDYEKAKANIGDFTKFKDKVMSSVFKCKQSSEAFLEKMEEFENVLLEEELTNAMKNNEISSQKKKGYKKRRSSLGSTDNVGLVNENLKKPKKNTKK